jgi:hypothetical protein
MVENPERLNLGVLESWSIGAMKKISNLSSSLQHSSTPILQYSEVI